MKLFTTGFVMGAVLSGTFWALASSPSIPSPEGARPDRLWQQDRGAAIQRYLEQQQHDVLHEQPWRKQQGTDPLAHPC